MIEAPIKLTLIDGGTVVKDANRLRRTIATATVIFSDPDGKNEEIIRVLETVEQVNAEAARAQIARQDYLRKEEHEYGKPVWEIIEGVCKTCGAIVYPPYTDHDCPEDKAE